MIPWEFLDSAQVPDKGETLRLYKRGEAFSIRVGSCELMNSCVHGSEEALAELTCDRISDRPFPRILIGGLGMGYTAAAALTHLGSESQVTIAELVPTVVAWNRGVLSHLSGYPLEDSRVIVHETDVADLIKEAQGYYDAILLDVDNGPEGLTRKGNDRLYSSTGLGEAFSALKPGGVLAVWSTTRNKVFVQRLNKAGFKVEEKSVRARGARGGSRHTIWFAERRLQR